MPQMSSVREPQVPSQDVEVTQETNRFVRASHWIDDVSPTNPVTIDEELGNVSSIVSDSVYYEAANASHSGRNGSTVTASDVTQVYIHLRNGSRILVPISASAAVAQLHAEAVRRATALGITCTTSSTILRTTGQNTVAVFGEDGLASVLSATDNDTFLLDLVFECLDLPASAINIRVRDPAATPTTTSPPSSSVVSLIYPDSSRPELAEWETSAIYVRWITPKSAGENSCLGDIEVDPNPVSSSMLLSDFKRLAFERCYNRSTTEADHPTGIHAELYLSYCYLSTSTKNAATLKDIELEGNQQKPLDVFVVTVRSGIPSVSKPQGSWGFESTDRGAATFFTSLKIIVSEIEKKHASLESILEILWEVTHFPPALIALRQIYDMGVTKAPSVAIEVLAECLREVSLKVAPPWIMSHPKRALETSRQIFAWLYSLRFGALVSRGGNNAHVHPVELRDVTTVNKINLMGAFKCQECVEVPILDDRFVPSQKRVLVSLDRPDHVPPKALAYALNGEEDSRCNYYFHLPSKSRGLLEHKRTETPQSSDFYKLLETANQVDAFNMVGPLQLAACTSASLPIVSLDADGFVSVYDQEDIECGERAFFTWNIIQGKKRMPETNPGQYLLQKLEPIIVRRKKENSWEIDAWTESVMKKDLRVPDEVVVVCVDTSSSMGLEMGRGWIDAREKSKASKKNAEQDQLSRLTEVKDVFRNLVSRISAYNLPVHLGLVTFSTQSSVKQSLTPVVLNFQYQLDYVYAADNTAIWNAIVTATQMLISVKANYPGAKCRIILLTDGDDNRSTYTPFDVCSKLYTNDIVLDAIVIGTDSTKDLFKIAKHTGGYAFNPKTRSALFQIPLLETFIDIKTRPDIVKVPITNFHNSKPKLADMPNSFDFPQCRPHINQDDYFIALRDAHRFLTSLSKQTSQATSAASTLSGLSTTSGKTAMSGTTLGTPGLGRHVLNEIRAMIDNQHEYMDVYVSESNMGFWKVVMQGPPESPYEDGTFLLYVEIGEQFPRKAPTARFITPMLHPNITKHGRICHPIFDREWTAATRVYQILQHIWGMLMSIEARDVVDPLFTLKFWTGSDSGRNEVKAYVLRFASRSRAALGADILGPKTSSTAPKTSSSASSNKLASYFSLQRRPVTIPSPNPTALANLSLARSPSSIGRNNSLPQVTPPPSTPTSSTASVNALTPQSVQSIESSVAGSVPGSVVDLSLDVESVVSASSGRRRRFFARFVTN